MSRKLYVGNLPYEIGETELQELFARAGSVESVSVMRDQATGRAPGSRWAVAIAFMSTIGKPAPNRSHPMRPTKPVDSRHAIPRATARDIASS